MGSKTDDCFVTFGSCQGLFMKSLSFWWTLAFRSENDALWCKAFVYDVVSVDTMEVLRLESKSLEMKLSN